MKRIIVFLSFLITSLFGASQELNSFSLFEYAKKNSPQLLNSASDIYMSEQKINEVRASGLPKINGELSFQNFINVPTTVVPWKYPSCILKGDYSIGEFYSSNSFR